MELEKLKEKLKTVIKELGLNSLYYGKYNEFVQIRTKNNDAPVASCYMATTESIERTIEDIDRFFVPTPMARTEGSNKSTTVVKPCITIEVNGAKEITLINYSQKEILERFANSSIKKDGSRVYNINGCEFTVGLASGDLGFESRLKSSLKNAFSTEGIKPCPMKHYSNISPE